MEKFTKNDMDDFKTKKIGVNCKTKELAIEFLSFLDDDGWCWMSGGEKPLDWYGFYSFGSSETYHRAIEYGGEKTLAHFSLDANPSNYGYIVKEFKGWEEPEEESTEWKVKPKPPLGVMPKYIFEEKRIMDLCRALYEYSQYKIDENTAKPMTDWTIELCERLNNINK